MAEGKRLLPNEPSASERLNLCPFVLRAESEVFAKEIKNSGSNCQPWSLLISDRLGTVSAVLLCTGLVAGSKAKYSEVKTSPTTEL